MAGHRRGPWSQAEDAYLIQLVHSQGAHNWVRISHLIASRSPKQCRERFHQNLKPSLNHEPITPEEGIIIERLVGEMGKRWAEIARRLRGRSDNAVKNWWNGGMNRRRRLVVRRDGTHRSGDEFDERVEALSFARPASTAERPLRNIMVPSVQRNLRSDPPLKSPAVSEVSMSDSIGEAPSLISDHTSLYSTSPIAPAQTPSMEFPPPPLPPTHSTSLPSSGRRPNLPQLPLVVNSILTDHAHNFHPSKHPEKPSLPSHQPAHHSLFQLAELATTSNPVIGDYHQRRAQPPLRQQFKLPPLPPLTRATRSTESRDTRMRLSSLLD